MARADEVTFLIFEDPVGVMCEHPIEILGIYASGV
jgi:hypothetical protein